MANSENKKEGAFYSRVKQLGILTTIPIILLVGPAVGFFLGDWIDRKFQSYPWFTAGFVFLGFAAAGREVVRLLKEVLREEERIRKFEKKGG